MSTTYSAPSGPGWKGDALSNNVFDTIRGGFRSGVSRDPGARVALLKRIRDFILRERDALNAALFEDLGKSETEALMCEIMPVLQVLNLLIRKTVSWSAPRRAAVSVLNFPATGRIVPEPFGTVLVVSAWNYPLLLALEPLAGALAAGNCVILRPHPAAAATAVMLKKLVAECASPEQCACLDDPPEELAGWGFDYVFFTGGAPKGRKVAAAAAGNLTPFTLELGGKSPCIVSESCDLKLAARRIAWGKFLNAGQTCVAPDYVLAEQGIMDDLKLELRNAITEFYGPDPEASPDYPRIISDWHFNRLVTLLGEGRLVAGGEHNSAARYIAPTVIDNVKPDSQIMSSEIFGPILPLLPVDGIREAVDFINARPKPLALYLFTNRRAERRTVIRETSSGSVAVNDTVMQIMNPAFPFGGVGESGCGAYHGKLTFQCFCHMKPVMKKCRFPELPVRFPPYLSWKRKLARLVCR